MLSSIFLLSIIFIALIFEFINGFHDTANVVATPIATRSLSPFQAILIAAIFNFIGAYFSTGVAKTITSGLFDAHFVTHLLLVSALLSAIGWNLITWWLGIPSSSSHALIGSLLGAVLISDNGIHAIKWSSLIDKVIIPMVLSPIIAFVLAFLIMLILSFFLNRSTAPRRNNNFIRELQVLSASLLAFSHGSNDAQKTMAIITLALFSFGILNTASIIPHWVIILCSIAMAAGTLAGGMRIIRTLSSRLTKLKPANGFSAEISSGALILAASHFGLPVSTTQAASGSIMGAGFSSSGINWSVVRSMVSAWILTLPITAIISALIYKMFLIFVI
ncbi:MAG: inorganic phosphate transporter [Burkholderiales bacterium]|jgi:PiT family inorganic phosphate transporter|nr:inorganic phosphate transporter [Burkholderiales bacterium]